MAFLETFDEIDAILIHCRQVIRCGRGGAFSSVVVELEPVVVFAAAVAATQLPQQEVEIVSPYADANVDGGHQQQTLGPRVNA